MDGVAVRVLAPLPRYTGGPFLRSNGNGLQWQRVHHLAKRELYSIDPTISQPLSFRPICNCNSVGHFLLRVQVL